MSTVVPLWLNSREIIAVPRGTRAVWPSGERFVVLLLPDKSVWLAWADGGEPMRFPDESSEAVSELYFSRSS